MAEHPFTLGPGGTISAPLTFAARSVMVDNPGGQWVWFPVEGSYVAPWTVGAVVLLRGPTQIARAQSTPPAGQVNTGAGNIATLRFTDLLLLPTPGTPITALSTTAGVQYSTFGTAVGPPAPGTNWLFTAPQPAALVTGTSYRVKRVVFALLPEVVQTTDITGFWELTYQNSAVFGWGQWNLGTNNCPPTGIDRLFDPPWEFVAEANGIFTMQLIALPTPFTANMVSAGPLYTILPVTV